MRNPAQRNHDRARTQGPDLVFQVAIALPHLGRQRLVGRRQAFDGIADPAIRKAKAIAERD